ncbi:hypothetical protein TNCV_3574911 [Trichonephila clavipes]|nr:hypothetical protein TNCV_3574911 [Trichonephila clavipes]
MRCRRVRAHYEQLSDFEKGRIIGMKVAVENVSEDSHGARAGPAFNIASHTGLQPGVMVCGAIYFDSQTSFGRHESTLTAQRYVDDILRTDLLRFL